MRIIFAGTPNNAAHCLDVLVESGFDVAGVLTREDAPFGRNKVLTESPVASVALRHGIELMRANAVSVELAEWVSSVEADLGVIVAYGSILKKAVLDTPKKGWINLHYSLLPDFPGAAPVQHALMAGRTSTGVTVFRLDEGIDTGPILAQKEVEIGIEQSFGELLSELTAVGSELLVDTLAHIEDRFATQKSQTVPSGMPVAGKISRLDARLDFSKAAIEVHNLVRAMNPEPVAWFEYSGLQVRVLESSVDDSAKLGRGEGALLSGELVVGCSDQAIKLLKVQPAGKKAMPGADWFRGLRQESISVI